MDSKSTETSFKYALTVLINYAILFYSILCYLLLKKSFMDIKI